MMKNKSFYLYLLAIVFLLNVSVNYAQNNYMAGYVNNTRSIAMGHTASTAFSDVFSGYLNPASLSQAEAITSSLFYTSFKDDKSFKGGGIAIPVPDFGTLGISYIDNTAQLNVTFADNAGFNLEEYKEQQFLLSYARSLGYNLALGMNVKYVACDYQNYYDSNMDYSGIDFSLQYKPDISNVVFRNTAIGFAVNNALELAVPTEQSLLKHYNIIVDKKISNGKNVLSLIANVVFHEQYVHENQYSVEMVKKVSKPRFFWGAEYRMSHFYFRAGHAISSLSGGMGVFYKSFRFEYSYGPLAIDSFKANSFSVSYGF